MTTDENTIQLTNEDITKLQENLTKDKPAIEVDSGNVEELQPHPQAKEKFELIKKYKGKVVNLILMKINASGDVISGVECPKLKDYDEEKDTVTFTNCYLSKVETQTNNGVSYYDDIVFEHASWMDIKEGKSTRQHMSLPIGSPTLIFTE